MNIVRHERTYRTAYLWEEVLPPDSLLDLLEKMKTGDREHYQGLERLVGAAAGGRQ